MSTDTLGRKIINTTDLQDILYSSKFSNLQNLSIKNSLEITKYNKYANEFDLPLLNTENIDQDIKTFDSFQQKIWLMPSEYYEINLKDFFLKKCTNHKEVERYNLEYKIYSKHNLLLLLKYLIFLVDTMREKNIIWGVGRGSSVASFILYLIGIHKINPLHYNLNFDEFLK